MSFQRSSGILLHPTSLPGPYGIGDLGPQAYRFVDFLAEAGCGLWQVLPLGPTGYGDSPYQCFSAFAGNPYLISLDDLIHERLLEREEVENHPDFPLDRVDYGAVIPWKLSLLERAFQRFIADPRPDLRAALDVFLAENADWLDDFALFMALKDANGGGSWEHWPTPLRMREDSALRAAREKYQQEILRFAFYQFLFFRQWTKLRAYANERKVQIIGDIPIFVAFDSADVWSHPELFYLDEARKPTVVAGVPPDLFSPTGQLWGNPLYRWEIHRQDQFSWWRKRIRATLKMVDIIRLDHFRGFAGYWEIPAGNLTAEFGRWVPGPGADLFDAIVDEVGHSSGMQHLPIIAEDLGVITPDVIELRERYHLPGMRILQFAFSGPENPFLPHHYVQNCVAYTGTHDNDTARGWFESASPEERHFALRYLSVSGEHFAWDLIRAIWASVAVFAIAPMQDLLNLGKEARMNYPSRLGGNWEWRMKPGDIASELAQRIAELNYLYSRKVG